MSDRGLVHITQGSFMSAVFWFFGSGTTGNKNESLFSH